MKHIVGLLVVLALAACGAVALAQQPAKVPRVGFLTAISSASMSDRMEAFQKGLRELGYVEGKTIVIEYRYAEGKLDRLPAFAAELVRLKVDVIVTAGASGTGPAKEATTTIPIVMTQAVILLQPASSPVWRGLVATSLDCQRLARS
jgi:putative tryptophan/tyrosine transport system substrate-binding protein